MEGRLIEALETSPYLSETEISKPRLLIYLMGPYKSYPPYESPSTELGVATTRTTLDEAVQNLQSTETDFDADEALWLLIELRRRL